jgi:hypothetical protein
VRQFEAIWRELDALPPGCAAVMDYQKSIGHTLSSNTEVFEASYHA